MKKHNLSKKLLVLFLPFLLFGFLVNPQIAFGQLRFASPTVYAAIGGNPNKLAIADFTGDGKPDIVVLAVNGVGLVLLYVNQGSGTFASAKTVIQLTEPEGIAAGDFNSDGKQDLLVIDAFYTLHLYTGNGNGTFNAGTVVQGIGVAASVKVADFNNDNKPDILVITSINAIALLLGNGDGTFTNQGAISTGGANDDFTIGDFNGDGKPDVATVSYDNDIVSVLINTGNGGFAPVVQYPVGDGCNKIAAGNFTGNGRSDLAVGRINQNVFILSSNSDGTFKQGVTLPVLPYFLTAADYNGDGLADVAGGGFGRPLSVFLGNESGALTNGGSFPIGGEGYSEAKSADLNGDSRPDLVVTNVDDQSISVLLNTSQPCPKPVISASGATKLCSGDSVTLTASVSLSYLWNNGATSQAITVKTAGAYTVTTTVAGGCINLTSDTTAVTVGLCDSDGDGIPDSLDCDPLDPKNDKVLMCHRGHTICVSRDAVNAHLKHGDYLGNCKGGCGPVKRTPPVLIVYPNPNYGHFIVVISNATPGKGELEIVDIKGTVIEKRQIQLIKGREIVQFNLGRRSGGLYMVKLIDEEGVQTFKMIIQH